MSKQCLNIEQMQHLKELGVDDSNASVYWHNVVKFEKKKKLFPTESGLMTLITQKYETK